MLKNLLSCALVFCSLSLLGQNDTEELKAIEPYKVYQSWSADMTAGLFLPLKYSLNYYGFGFFPRYNFIAPKEYLSVSAGAPMNVGLDVFVSSGGSIIQYMIDLPLVLDFNIGSRATRFDDTPFGAFLGGGLAYNFSHLTFGTANLNLHTFGPMVHGGFRWRMNGRETGVRISYLSGFGKRSEEVNGIIVEGQPGNKILSISVIYGIN